jgi:hypothetical protein
MRVEANDRGEKRNVLIVGVLLLVGSNLTLRSNTQRRIQILRVRQPTLRYTSTAISAKCHEQNFGSHEIIPFLLQTFNFGIRRTITPTSFFGQGF